ncbi:MAG TPA: hypothetical protein VEA39_02690 [Methylophilaceae bacterium]|nr:hypothetical protein [Methylophilaceae bacterium]
MGLPALPPLDLKRAGNTLLSFYWEHDSLILFHLLPEVPGHQTYICHLYLKSPAHTAEHEMQAQHDKLSKQQFSVQRLRHELAGFFTTQHV